MKRLPACCFAVLAALAAAAAVERDLGKNGVELKVVSEPDTVDPAQDFFVTVTMTADEAIGLQDLRDRFRGFQVAEDFTEEPVKGADGRVTRRSRWRLVPEPHAESYSLRPFVVNDFYTAPVEFAPPPAPERVTGPMELDVKKDLPPLSWPLVGWCALALAAFAAAVRGLWLLAKKLREMARVRRMSPVQRAYWELDRLLAKGLPERGRFKDFYVELTLVVRRYVQRQHGVSAPHLTTEEFFEATKDAPGFSRDTLAELMDFLRKADMVKFAGVAATPETADAATSSARAYIAKDSAVAGLRP